MKKFNPKFYRISIDENNFLDIQWEQYVQEENLITPNDPLLFGLLMQPSWPFILNQFILEIIFIRHVWQEVNELRRQEIFQKPKFDRTLCVFHQ